MTDAHAVHVKTQFAARGSRVSQAKAAPKRINDVVRVTTKSLVVTPRPQPLKRISPLKAHSVTAHRVMDLKHTPASHVKAHKPQPARTLMRAAVKRPDPSLRRQAHAQTRTDILVKSPQLHVVPKRSSGAVDAQRLHRASHVAQSASIHRFAPDQASWFRQQVTPAAEPQPTVTSSPVATAASKPHSASKQRSMDIFQHALATATAHEQPLVDPKKRASKQRARPHHRLANIVAVSLAVVVLAGFFAYQNKTGITTRFASAKAGFHVALPSYQPSGYAAGTFRYEPGQVAVRYAKAGTSRNYTLSQKRSSLTDQQVLSTTVAPHSSTYQALRKGDHTVYLYGDGAAAWVSGGILYQITSAGNLTTPDILSIATSV